MKSKSSLWILLALLAVVGWASLETYRLWVATQQVADSQQLQMQVSAKLVALHAKHAHFANTEESARGPNPSQK
jgi:flagellar basal body-associated protein FliL